MIKRAVSPCENRLVWQKGDAGARVPLKATEVDLPGANDVRPAHSPEAPGPEADTLCF